MSLYHSLSVTMGLRVLAFSDINYRLLFKFSSASVTSLPKNMQPRSLGEVDEIITYSNSTGIAALMEPFVYGDCDCD
jgi:hypothetical protein